MMMSVSVLGDQLESCIQHQKDPKRYQA